MTPPAKKFDWSNTWWGKLLLGAGAVLVGMLVNRVGDSVSDVSDLPQLIRDVRVLKAHDAARMQRDNYDSIRVVLQKEQLAKDNERHRVDDSLRRLDALEYYGTQQYENRKYLPKSKRR